MQYLRYNTDSQEVVFGIFVDSTDGNTEETGLTIANTDIKIWKTGATTLANKNSGGATHISNGIYYAVFDSTDTNTLGSGKAYVHVSGALYQVLEFCVLPQKVYDSMIAGSDNLEVDTIQIEGADATNQLNAATPAVTVSDKTGFSLSSSQSFNLTGNITGNLSGSVGSVTGGVTVTTNNDKTGYTASTVSDKTGYSLSTAGVTAVQSGLATTGEAASALASYDPPTNAEMIARTLPSADYFNPASDTVARVTLVDTCTTNTDMRGTDGAYTGTPPTVNQIQTGLAKTTDITALNDISVADILAGETESGLTLRHAMQIITALALKATGGGTSSISFRNYGDTKNRLTMTVDEDGNRTAVTISLD